MKKTNHRPRPRVVYATAALVALAVGAAALPGSDLHAARAAQETIVVYPASATSKTPETVAAIPPAVQPVPETGDYDPETPLGQVRAVLETLRRLRDGQQDCAKTLAGIVERLEASISTRADELRAALDANTERIAGLENALAQTPRRDSPNVGDEGKPAPAPDAERGSEPSSPLAELSALQEARWTVAFWRAVALLVVAALVWDRVRARDRGAATPDRAAR